MAMMAPEPGEIAISAAARTNVNQVAKDIGEGGVALDWRAHKKIADGRQNAAGPSARCCLLLLRVDGGLQGGASREFWRLRRSDLDRFAGRWVAALACGALGDGEGAEAGDTNRVPFFEALGDDFDDRVDCAVGGGTRHFGTLRKFSNQFAFFHNYPPGFKRAGRVA